MDDNDLTNDLVHVRGVLAAIVRDQLTADHGPGFHIGRLAIYLEPRDIWIGAYIAPRAVYVCPLPMLVIRWIRGAR